MAGRLPFDAWTIDEYERLCETVENNLAWIARATVAVDALADAHDLFAAHKRFLADHGLLPPALAARPSPSFRRAAGGGVAFVR